MAVKGKFNTDARALDCRIETHDKYGSNDLNRWIFENLALSEGQNVLDLGSGTGKQSIPIAQVIGNGRVSSVDLSSEALDSLVERAVAEGVASKITPLNCSHDEIEERLGEEQFDRVVSSYSLYYTSDAERLIRAIWNKLKRGGLLFYCGPSMRNNSELKEFHYALVGREEAPAIGASLFMEGVGREKTIEIFDRTEVVTFENVLRFDSVDGLYNYWSSYNLYDESIDAKFRSAAKSFFEHNEVFETVKRVVGIKAYKDKEAIS